MTTDNVIDISRMLEDRSLALSPDYSRALLSIALAFAEYAGLEGDELARLIETARTAGGVDLGTLAVLEAVGFEWATRRPFE